MRDSTGQTSQKESLSVSISPWFCFKWIYCMWTKWHHILISRCFHFFYKLNVWWQYFTIELITKSRIYSALLSEQFVCLDELSMQLQYLLLTD